MSGDKHSRPKTRSNIIIQDIGDEAMVYDSDGEKIHVLNHSALAIWKFCDGKNTCDDIYKKMSELYPDAGIELSDDIKSTINELKIKGLLD